MTETIEIEVTEGVKEQYEALVDEHGEGVVQSDLLNTILPPIRNGYQQIRNGHE